MLINGGFNNQYAELSSINILKYNPLYKLKEVPWKKIYYSARIIWNFCVNRLVSS